MTPCDGFGGEIARGVNDKRGHVRDLGWSKDGKAMEFDAVDCFVGAEVDEFALGMVMIQHLLHGKDIFSITSATIGGDDVWNAILLGLIHSARGPRPAHDVGGVTVDGGTKVERDGGELAVAAALREEHFVLGRDVHDATNVGNGRGEDAAEFWRAVRESHGAETVGREASLDYGRFDDGWEGGGAGREVVNCGAVRWRC